MTKVPDFKEQLRLIRQSGQLHGSWYRQAYSDVDATDITPAEHYLRYGAALGRQPRAGFDTQFYQKTYPDVAESGLNPLVHYLLHGKAEGRQCLPDAEDPWKAASDTVQDIRFKLLSMGLTARALSELRELASTGATPELRGVAAHELACWHMREKTPEGYRAALDAIADAVSASPTMARRTRLETLRLLCHLHLGEHELAHDAFHRAGNDGLVSPDVLLAWANFHDDPDARLWRINMVLQRFRIHDVALLPDDTLPAYDRLTLATPLPEVFADLKVTVLIAAYAAEATIGTALRAMQEQTWKNLQIIVLDDCSPDGTCAVVEKVARDDPRVTLVRMPQNAGAYVARNEGLDLALGEYVTLHDADDWAHPLRIETQVRYLKDHPDVIACTTQQARADSNLGFTRWTGEGHFIIPNTSSLMFRRGPMQTRLGYWDTARFSCDQELIRRMKQAFGRRAVVDIKSGPLAFQRDSGSSIVADDALGINGFLFGARKEYFDAQKYFHSRSEDLRYPKAGARHLFPVPAIMRHDRPADASARHFDVIIASDLRMDGGSSESCIQEIRAAREGGYKVGLIEMYRYDLGNRTRRDMLPSVRAEIDGEKVQFITFGEEVTCDLLVVRYPPVLQELQRYLPKVAPGAIKVVINQPPMSDYSEQGILRYDLKSCAENIRQQFGKDAVWLPNGPMVREALLTHHAADLQHIDLSPVNWDNIIHLAEWDRGPRNRGPNDRLRIGRHSRDSYVKWPDTAEDVLAAYPEADDVEVRILGGADTPSALIGHTPANWVVHRFNAINAQQFLAKIDVFVFFAHPDWVESFPRVVLEAMAVGVPVILPESHQPLFGDRALYATPQTSLSLARQLHADPQAYDAQVRKAQDYLKQHYSYDMHARRLQAAGVRRSLETQ